MKPESLVPLARQKRPYALASPTTTLLQWSKPGSLLQRFSLGVRGPRTYRKRPGLLAVWHLTGRAHCVTSPNQK